MSELSVRLTFSYGFLPESRVLLAFQTLNVPSTMQKRTGVLKRIRIPQLRIDVSKAKILVGSNGIQLSPMEFCYYRYFAERAQARLGSLSFGSEPPDEFVEKILELHRESFPNADSFRQLFEAGAGRDLSTIRAHISKLNAQLRRQLRVPELFEQFKIRASGARGVRAYELALPDSEIKVLSLKVYPRFKREVAVVRPDDTLISALRLMDRRDFSQVVVFVDGRPRLLTTEGIARWMSSNIEKRAVDLRDVEVREVLPFERKDTLVLSKKDQTLVESREILSNSIRNNIPHVYAILIVDSISRPTKLFGIITPWDFLDREYW